MSAMGMGAQDDMAYKPFDADAVMQRYLVRGISMGAVKG